MDVVVVVHGIGSHPPGEVLAAARAGIPDGGSASELREFNWSRIPGVVSGPTLSFDNIRRMTQGLAATARLGAAGNHVALAAEVVFGLAVTVPLLAPLMTGILMLAGEVDVWRALRIQLAAIAMLLALTGAAAVAFLLGAVFAAAMTRDTAPIAEWLRWLVLMVARPIALVCLLPFAPFLWEFLTWGGETSKVFTWLGVTGVFTAAFGWLWGEPWAAMGNVAVGALVVAGWCLAWFAGQLVFFVFGPTLKALLDVFRYLGDGELRAALRNAFDDFIGKLPASSDGNRAVAIYAHSLGTVITLDSLLRSTAWTARDDVRLVTCGSPVRRLVMRFFPEAIFPRGLDSVTSRIAPGLRSFRWVNFYRRFDYVGGSLGLTRLGLGRDVRSRSLTKSHSGYFVDGELWSVASAALPVAPDLTARMPATPARRSSEPLVSVSPVLPWLANLVQYSGFVLAPSAAILFAVVTVAQGGRLGSDPADAVRNSLQRGNRISAATVTHWRVLQPGDPPDEIDHFRFEWDGRPPVEVAVTQGELVFSGQQTLFDVGGLREAVRADCQLLEARAPLQRSVRVPCRSRRPIQLRYATDRPDHFDLPGFPPRTSLLRRGFDWFRLLLVGVGWCLIGGALNTWLAGQWIRLVFGARD